MTQLAPKPDPIEAEPQPTEALNDVKPKRQIPWRGLLLGVAVGVAATFAIVRFAGLPTPQEQTEESSTMPPGVTPEDAVNPDGRAVTTIVVRPQAIAQRLSVVGTVSAGDIVAVSAARSGLQITNLLVDEGDTVRAGQLVAQLDSNLIQAELRQAQAQVRQSQARLAELRAGARPQEIARAQEQVKQAEASLARNKADLALIEQRLGRNQELFDEGAIAADTLDELRARQAVAKATLSQSEAVRRESIQRVAELRQGSRPEVIAQAQAQLQQSQAQVNIVNARLSETRVLAPRSGQILEKFAQIGRLSSAEQPLFHILEAGQLELEGRVPETELARVRVGQNVAITSNGDASLSLSGRVTEIVPTVDQQSRQATVKISLPQNPALKPGMFLQASITLAQTQGISIPTEAVIPQDGSQGTVFRLNQDNTVTALTVELGELLDNEQIQIISGLNSGDRLVLKGAAYLKDGETVTVQSEQPTSPSSNAGGNAVFDSSSPTTSGTATINGRTPTTSGTVTFDSSASNPGSPTTVEDSPPSTSNSATVEEGRPPTSTSNSAASEESLPSTSSSIPFQVSPSNTGATATFEGITSNDGATATFDSGPSD